MGSSWLKTDLHIHSYESNKTIHGDYIGKSYTAIELFNVLLNTENKINIFSITDHNIINLKLYSEIFELLEKEEYKRKINCIVGVELNFFDESIHTTEFHVLCFFESRDLAKINDAISDMGKPPYDLKRLFESISKKDLGKFALIPHFNKKSDGIYSDPSEKEIEYLNRLFFDAYEDANNHVNISKSLRHYLSEGFVDFPIVAFSDCHNIENYPLTNKGDREKTICSILGTLEYPFDSLRTAFEEPSLRISIKGVDFMRSININYDKIISVIEDGKKYTLSPYQNTIIGPFGSGKSYFLDKIQNGIEKVKKIYSGISSNIKDYKVQVGTVNYSSLFDARDERAIDNIVIIDQYESIYYNSKITENDIKDLSDRLGFIVPKLDDYKIEYNWSSFIDNIKKIKHEYDKVSSAKEFNYKKAFDEKTKYYLSVNDTPLNFDKLDNNIININIDFNNLINTDYMGIPIFDEEEVKIIKNFESLLDSKKELVEKIKETVTAFNTEFVNKLNHFNSESITKSDKEIKNDCITILKGFCNNLLNLSVSIKHFNEIYNPTVFEKIKNTEKSENFFGYKIVCKYESENNEFESILDYLFSRVANNKVNLISRLLELITSNGKVLLKGKKQFGEIEKMIYSYKSKIESMFVSTNLNYDIKLPEPEKDKSILKLSPGDRSKNLINLAFNKIKKDLEDGKRTVVLIDQPENNMDNNSVNTSIVKKMKEIKIKDKNNLITFIIVTHNANVCITADSENIIIASNNDNNFSLKCGVIEDKGFMDNVCNILEGGRDALTARASKYHINIHRKVLKK